MKVASCTIVKLENNYLKEFVEHYKSIGFDHMFIYDNNDENDEHPEEVLQEYIDEGFVTVIDYRNQEKYPMGSALISAFTDCWENNKNEYDWILFCDNDEFLNFSKDKNVKEYLSRDVFKNYDVIKINWKCYDDNGLLCYDPRPLKERFTHYCHNSSNFWENKHTKSFIHNIAKDKKIIFWKGAAHSPYLFVKENPEKNKLNLCDGSGNNLEGNYWDMHEIYYINHELCWLDHYRMKTIDEYINNKIKKLSDKGYKNIAFSNHKFFEYNRYTKKKEKIYLDYILNHSKNCVYTCITGDYDDLHDPIYVTPGWKYICFTNNHNLHSDIWEIRYIEEEWLDNKIKAHKNEHNYNQYINREIKLRPFIYLKEFDFSIYIDGNITITGDLNEFKKKYIDVQGSYKYIMWTLEHYRNCIYDEIDACIKQNKDDINKLEKLKQFYRKEKMPKNYGMTHNCFIARYHLDQVCSRLMWYWWDAVMKYTVRDQCVLMYVLRDCKINKKSICILKNDDINNYINYYESYGKHK